MRIRVYAVFAIVCLGLVLAVSAIAQQPPETFVGTVVQASPLQVRSLDGEVRQITLPDSIQSSPKPGDLVRVTYQGDATASAISKFEIIGATLSGTVKEIAVDRSGLVVRTQQPNHPENEVNVPLQTSSQFQPLVAAMRPGDGITAAYERDKAHAINSVRSLEWQSKLVSRPVRWVSLIGAAAALLLLAIVFTKCHPTSLYLGADNRYSSSKFQTVLWFWLVISGYIAIVIHRIAASEWTYIGGVDIPPNLLILSGISVLTFATAKAITIGKVEQAAARGEDPKPSAPAPKAGNLIQDDFDRTDLGDFQMVGITIMAVIIYAIAVVEFMQRIEFRRVITMPDVDAMLLAIFGLGQAAYLGKKAAGEPGRD